MGTSHEALVDTIQQIHRRGWCEGTGGNFSLVMQASPCLLLMAPSGVDKGGVTTDMLIEVDAQGEVTMGDGRASAETRLHLDIVKRCRAGAVLHTHSTNATLLSRRHQNAGKIIFEGWEMLKGLAGITTHETSVELPVVANNQDMHHLSDSVQHLLPNAAHGFLVAGHGLYAWGKNLKEAKRHLEILEFLLEVEWKQQIHHQDS